MPTKKTIAWPIEWCNKDPSYWFQKDDSFQDALVHLAEAYDVVVAVLHPTRTDSTIIKGVRYLFCKTRKQLVDRIVKLDPALVNYWGFGRPSSRELDELLPDTPKTVYPVGDQAKAAPTADLPFVDRVFATTTDQQQKIWAETHYPRRQVIVCPFAGTKTFIPKEEYGRERYDVIYVSDWRPIKRQQLLGEAIPAIEFDRLIFLGDLQDRKYFERFVGATRGLQNKAVEIIHRVPPRLAAGYYRESKVAVQLSESEGGSRVVIEAMASGLPLIVCRDCETNAQQVIHGETGFVIDPTPEAVARQINALLADPALCEKIGRAAAEHIWKRPVEETMAGIFEREFRKILATGD